MTRSAVTPRSTSKAEHSGVYSSVMANHFNGCPLVVRSWITQMLAARMADERARLVLAIPIPIPEPWLQMRRATGPLAVVCNETYVL